MNCIYRCWFHEHQYYQPNVSLLIKLMIWFQKTLAHNSYGPLLWCVFVFIILKSASSIFLYFVEQTRGRVNNDRISYLFGQTVPLNHSSCWMCGLEWNAEITLRDPHKEPLFLLSPPPLDNHMHTCKHTKHGKEQTDCVKTTYTVIWLSVSPKYMLGTSC